MRVCMVHQIIGIAVRQRSLTIISELRSYPDVGYGAPTLVEELESDLQRVAYCCT